MKEKYIIVLILFLFFDSLFIFPENKKIILSYKTVQFITKTKTFLFSDTIQQKNVFEFDKNNNIIIINQKIYHIDSYIVDDMGCEEILINKNTSNERLIEICIENNAYYISIKHMKKMKKQHWDCFFN